MKKILTALLLGFVLVLTGCSDMKNTKEETTTKEEKEETPSTGEEGSTQVANPIKEYDSLEKASKAVGFTIKCDFEDQLASFSVISGEILEVSADKVSIRKAKGSDDISGDYNEYKDIASKVSGDKKITLKGNKGKYSLILMTYKDYSYAVSLTDAVDAKEALEIIKGIE